MALRLVACGAVKTGIAIANKTIAMAITAIDMPSITTVVVFEANKNFYHRGILMMPTVLIDEIGR